VGRRQRRRTREAKGSTQAGTGPPPATSDYVDPDGNTLTLRDELSAGTLQELERLDARPAATPEDRWQRRVEFLFERLAVRWEIAGLPFESQKELLGRYRIAGAEERRWVRETVAGHLRERLPEVEV
jgi:hypothetical protein